MSIDKTDKMFRKALAHRGHDGGPRMPDPLPKAMAATREKLGLSRRALAKLVGCSDVFIGKIESGQKFPVAHLLANLQQVLKLSNEVVQQHVYTRPYQFRMKTSEQEERGESSARDIRTSGGYWDEVPHHEKALQLIFATAVALRSSGYHAEPCLPSGRDQSEGVLPWVEIHLGSGATAVIKIEVREDKAS